MDYIMFNKLIKRYLAIFILYFIYLNMCFSQYINSHSPKSKSIKSEKGILLTNNFIVHVLNGSYLAFNADMTKYQNKNINSDAYLQYMYYFFENTNSNELRFRIIQILSMYKANILENEINAGVNYDNYGLGSKNLMVRKPIYKTINEGFTNSLINYSDVRIIPQNTIILDYYMTKKYAYVIIIADEMSNIRKMDIPDNFNALIQEYLSSLIFFHSDIASKRKILYDILLKPICQYLHDKNEIIIIPDGVLWSIPFETLLPNYFFNSLIEDKNISIKYHFSSKLSLRKSDEIFTNFSYLGIAPVIFHINYRKFKKNNSIISTKLQNTLYEIDSVYNMFKILNSKAIKLTYNGASKKNVISLLPNYNIIHFATHSIVNDVVGETGLVLYRDSMNAFLNLDTDSFNTIGNCLEINEILNMDIDAFLVVLNSCETATGLSVNGEGSISIAQSFINSGAKNCVATLWNIPDNFSMKFIIKFFDYLISGYSVSESLSLTKIHFRNISEYSHPYYWGAWIHIGKN